MSRAAFGKFINSLSEDDLKSEIKLLYGKFDDIKKHYAMELGSDADRKKLFDKAKKEIRNLLYIGEKARKRPRIQKIKNKLKEVSKLSIFQHETADLYLYAAEKEMSYIYARHSSVKALYNNCKENFIKACELINQLSLQDDFHKRCADLVAKANHVFLIEHEIKAAYKEVFD